MNVRIKPSAPRGEIRAIASKSAAHRLLICAAFADGVTRIRCEQTNRDIEATVDCLCALGASISRDGSYYTVEPIKSAPTEAVLHPCESGSTLRFLVPVVAALGAKTSFILEGRLPERPLSPLREELEAHGVTLSPHGSNPLLCEGKLTGNDFSIPGNVSSQFISGMLFALALCLGGGRLSVTGKIESAPYIDMTCDALRAFGIEVSVEQNVYTVKRNGTPVSPSVLLVEGDWSNAAFPLCAGAIGGDVTVSCTDSKSRQGDREIVELLRRFGADISETENGIRARRRVLRGIEIDATQIPDLVPVLATVASVAEGTTRICGASRLRIKESDRLVTVREMLASLGADVTETDDGLVIVGKPSLCGGTVSAAGDHRIAMSAAVASVACASDVNIIGADACKKSYPAFFDDMKTLGFDIKEVK